MRRHGAELKTSLLVCLLISAAFLSLRCRKDSAPVGDPGRPPVVTTKTARPRLPKPMRRGMNESWCIDDLTGGWCMR